VRVERSQMWTFLHQQINGSLLRFAMDAHVGDGVEPDLRGCLDGAEVAQFDSMQEILFDSRFAGSLSRRFATLAAMAWDRKSLRRPVHQLCRTLKLVPNSG